MKKMFAVILVVMLLPIISNAELVLKDMSDEQLNTLQVQIIEELLNRSKTKSIKMPPGTYVAGVDFPAGYYSLNSKAEYTWTTVIIYLNEQDMKMYTRQIEVDDLTYLKVFSKIKTFMVQPDSPANIKLEEGHIVQVDTDVLYLSPFVGLEIVGG